MKEVQPSKIKKEGRGAIQRPSAPEGQKNRMTAQYFELTAELRSP